MRFQPQREDAISGLITTGDSGMGRSNNPQTDTRSMPVDRALAGRFALEHNRAVVAGYARHLAAVGKAPNTVLVAVKALRRLDNRTRKPIDRLTREDLEAYSSLVFKIGRCASGR